MYQYFIWGPKAVETLADYTVKTPPLYRPNLLKRHWDLLRIVVGEQSHHPQHRAMSIIFLLLFCDNELCIACGCQILVGYVVAISFATLPQADRLKLSSGRGVVRRGSPGGVKVSVE